MQTFRAVKGNQRTRFKAENVWATKAGGEFIQNNTLLKVFSLKESKNKWIIIMKYLSHYL